MLEPKSNTKFTAFLKTWSLYLPAARRQIWLYTAIHIHIHQISPTMTDLYRKLFMSTIFFSKITLNNTQLYANDQQCHG